MTEVPRDLGIHSYCVRTRALLPVEFFQVCSFGMNLYRDSPCRELLSS